MGTTMASNFARITFWNASRYSFPLRFLIVRSVVADGCWLVSLEDDGHGFPFGGRKTQAQLNEHREGPRTILERARRIGADVTVESMPGTGSRIEMAIRPGSRP